MLPIRYGLNYYKPGILANLRLVFFELDPWFFPGYKETDS